GAVFLGADAGGSHSTVVLGPTKTIVGRADGPAAAMRPGGAAKSATVLAETARRAAAQAGLALPVERAVVGAAGAGGAQEQAELEAALIDAGVARQVRVLADGEVALATAFGTGPGILVNAGTDGGARAPRPQRRARRRRRGTPGRGRCGPRAGGAGRGPGSAFPGNGAGVGGDRRRPALAAVAPHDRVPRAARRRPQEGAPCSRQD